MVTYTFIVNYKKGIYVHQVDTWNTLQACHTYADHIIEWQE